MSTVNQKKIDAEVMAKYLALLVLQHPEKVNNLLKQYNIDSTDFDPQMRLLYVERLIQTNIDFAKTITNLIFETFDSTRNFVEAALIGGIAQGLGGVMNGVAGIIDATSDSGKRVRETMAQAKLAEAQAQIKAAEAQIQQAKAMQIAAAKKKQNLTSIVGVAVAGMVLSIAIFAYFKFKK